MPGDRPERLAAKQRTSACRADGREVGLRLQATLGIPYDSVGAAVTQALDHEVRLTSNCGQQRRRQSPFLFLSVADRQLDHPVQVGGTS
jgi:hypothetical protein